MTGRRPVAVVTGAAGGIGAAIARRMAGTGHLVALVDVDADRLTAVQEAFGRDHPGDMAAYVGNVADHAAVVDIIDAVERDHGPVMALVNAAGVLHAAATDELLPHDWDHSLAVNATGVKNMLVTVVPRMAARGGGAVVTVTSNAAHTPRIGMGAYAASKAAAAMITRCVGLEYAAAGVRCNCVCPGSTDTPMLTSLAGSAAIDRSIAGTASEFRLGIPLGKVASPEDIAQTVTYLLSDAANHITLENVTVDGGATLGAK